MSEILPGWVEVLLTLGVDLGVVLDVVVVVGVGFDNVVEVDLLVRISIFFARSNVWRRFPRFFVVGGREKEKEFKLTLTLFSASDRAPLREIMRRNCFPSSFFDRTLLRESELISLVLSSFCLFVSFSLLPLGCERLLSPLFADKQFFVLRWKGWMKFEMGVNFWSEYGRFLVAMQLLKRFIILPGLKEGLLVSSSL